jgi:hypothetical protein
MSTADFAERVRVNQQKPLTTPINDFLGNA